MNVENNKHYYTNGITSKYLVDGTQPEGWIRGRAKCSEETKRLANEKRKKTSLEKYGTDYPLQNKEISNKLSKIKSGSLIYNNGSESRFFSSNEEVPEGWTLGRLPSERDSANEKRKQTNLERYGVEFTAQLDSSKEKTKQTNLERYGHECYLRSEEGKEKSKQTSLDKYGTEYPVQSIVVQEKTKQTNLERYGYEYTFQVPEVKEKITKSLLEKYNVEHPLQNTEILEKSKQTCLENHGVEFGSQTNDFKEKFSKTSQLHWGTDFPTQSPEVQEKSKQTSLERYGCEYTFQSKQLKDNRRKTFLVRYGVEHQSQIPEVKESKKRKSLEKYGYKTPTQSPEVQEKGRQTSLERYGKEYYTQTDEYKERVQVSNMEKYNVPWACMRPEARLGYSNDSTYNLKFSNLLKDNGVFYEREFNLGHYSYDFKVGNTLIEINPSATHNSLWGIFKDNGLDKNYHQKKSQTALESGYHCIHIFDWDDPNKIIKELLVTKERVYARNTNICKVSKDEAEGFLNIHHLQGSCNGQEVILGLYYQEELVSLMSFGKPRYNKNYEWELLRYCSSKNVIGGAKRLFSHFLREYQPKSIVSYCDNSKFSGNVYEKLGFVLKSCGSPSKHWYSDNKNESMQHITDNLLRQRGYDQLFHESYGKGTSNEELIIKRGYVPIYDSGQSTYVWKQKEAVNS